jgi:hypothetical protein
LRCFEKFGEKGERSKEKGERRKERGLGRGLNHTFTIAKP